MEVQYLFMEAMKAALENRTIQWEEKVTAEEWSSFFRLASVQNVIPVVYQSVYDSPAFQETGAIFAPALKRQVFQSVFQQVQKTQEFINLYGKLKEQGLEPIVVKGIICRNLYPNPDNRISGDEDLYIPAGEYDRYKQALAEADMELAEWDIENEQLSHEVSYNHKGGALRIELHKDLFDGELSAYKGMNEVFADSFQNSILMDVDGLQIRSLNYSDHMLFLIFHAFKHFVSSGFGVRQVCDIVMFANRYGAQIDWNSVQKKCKTIHADIFAAAVFDIGRKYLGFDWEMAKYAQCWRVIEVDSDNMLKDLLEAGIFGDSDMNRKHSSNITLSAVSAQAEGKKAGNSLLKTLFPSAEVLQKRYPWLKDRHFLLPFAWIDRILKYRKETKQGQNNDASGAVSIGNRRLELLKEYKILDNE